MSISLVGYFCKVWLQIFLFSNPDICNIVLLVFVQNNLSTAVKRPMSESSLEENMSKKKLKKLQKRQSENPHSRKVFEKCSLCPNPMVSSETDITLNVFLF